MNHEPMSCMCSGGVAAGVVSDYSGGRATTCCAMLLLAAPMVRIVACPPEDHQKTTRHVISSSIGLGLSHRTASEQTSNR